MPFCNGWSGISIGFSGTALFAPLYADRFNWVIFFFFQEIARGTPNSHQIIHTTILIGSIHSRLSKSHLVFFHYNKERGGKGAHTTHTHTHQLGAQSNIIFNERNIWTMENIRRALIGTTREKKMKSRRHDSQYFLFEFRPSSISNRVSDCSTIDRRNTEGKLKVTNIFIFTRIVAFNVLQDFPLRVPKSSTSSYPFWSVYFFSTLLLNGVAQWSVP